MFDFIFLNLLLLILPYQCIMWEPMGGRNSRETMFRNSTTITIQYSHRSLNTRWPKLNALGSCCFGLCSLHSSSFTCGVDMLFSTFFHGLYTSAICLCSHLLVMELKNSYFGVSWLFRFALYYCCVVSWFYIVFISCFLVLHCLHLVFLGPKSVHTHSVYISHLHKTRIGVRDI